VGIMPAGSGLTQWWFDVRWSRADAEIESPTTYLRDRFSTYPEPVSALLDAISDADVGLYPHVLHRVTKRWGTGPTTLLGDAAHAFPPSQAQGANQAFEHAWMLTRALGLVGDPTDLLRRYEKGRARRLLVSRMAASERTNEVPGIFLRVAARLTPTTVASRSYTRLVQRFSSVLSGDEP